MSYSFLVWNVEKYRAESKPRTQKVKKLISKYDPDVFGILEFKAKKVVRELVSGFYTDYDFGMTDSKMGIEILVGWKRDVFDQAIYTQRRTFQIGNINLRPGGLLSIRQLGNTQYENFLFLHTDSGKKVSDYDNRQEMFSKIFKLNKSLKNIETQNGESRLIALGDLNTMGRSKTDSLHTIRAKEEIEALENDAIANGMRLLSKSHDKTYRSAGGSLSGDLDHVIVSDDIQMQSRVSPNGSSDTYNIECDGWVNLTGNSRRAFIEHVADHALLYGEVIN